MKNATRSNTSDTVPKEEARLTPGFFLEDDVGIGQNDMNMLKYREKQIELSNRIEDLTRVAFWETKGQFAVYDSHLCKNNDPKQFIGSATLVPGIPMYWQKVDGIAELKYRTVSSTKFGSTLLDADKLMNLKIRTRDMDMDCYVIWAFTDGDMYLKIDPIQKFGMALGRNTKTSDDVPYEYKPQAFIPMKYLKPVTKEMFENGN